MIYEHLGYDRYERSSEPKVVQKRQKDISAIDDKIISMYAKGMTTRQISDTIEDILVLCADVLTGIKEAIGVAYPNTEYQRCIVLQVRNTLKYVADKDKKELPE